MRFSLRFIAGVAFAFGTLLAACSGNGGSTLPVKTPSTLAVSVDIPSTGSSTSTRRAMSVGARAKSAYVYVYGAGTAQTPPASSLAGVMDLSASSKDCVANGSGRTCRIQAKPANTGVMVIHVDFYDQAPSGSKPSGTKIGSTHTRATLTGNDAYGIVTDGTIARLGMTVSNSWLSGASDFSVALDPLDSEGKHVVATGVVAVYGPSGAVTASAAPQASAPPIVSDGVLADTSNGEARFHYTGAPFVNPMTVVGIVGTFAMTDQIWPSNPAVNPPPPTYPAGTPITLAQDPFASWSDPLKTEEYAVNVSIGSSVTRVQVDTGSELFLVRQDMISGADPSELLGPGEAGFETLSSDNNFYAGSYYLARVKIYDKDGTSVVGRTVPMRVLVNSASCTECRHDNLMGVGFGRPTSTPNPTYGPTYKLPVMNALLQQEKIVTGTDLAAGYRLSADKLQIGLAQSNTAGFADGNIQQLTRFQNRTGDWNTPLACISFDNAACEPATALVDVGIKYMILRGFGPEANAKDVKLYFLSGNGQDPSKIASTLSFKPTYGDPLNPPAPTDWATPPAPAYVNVRNTSPPPPPTINTGISPVYDVDYFYDNVYGRVGYKSNP